MHGVQPITTRALGDRGRDRMKIDVHKDDHIGGITAGGAEYGQGRAVTQLVG